MFSVFPREDCFQHFVPKTPLSVILSISCKYNFIFSNAVVCRWFLLPIFLFFKSCYFVASFHFHNDSFSDTIIKLNTLKNLPHSAFRFAHFECKHSNSLTDVLILMRLVIFNLFTGFRRFTHTVSNSAFRSFGQPHLLVWLNISIKILTWTTFSFSWLLTRM